ncbi:TetR/AcrR family transcriptional regulator [Kineobactrum salinum]|uniref:TetR/AcrR family transcriptional regulator n=1 Tax=Kineobactrum salinum TaxID=2708301 RepID=A0A6C0U420_9GAMM|nr:TetR/AcrR family transcriptional regulator [Kineobactrum salinum]QIB66786.1 TetR/AcrR family transcriptional regulator [Kineobactrum salinum]
MAKKNLSANDWIEAAKTALVKRGVDNVKVGILARDLDVSRGSFYWHFASRGELLDALLIDWAVTSTRAFEAVLQAFNHDGSREFEKVFDIWLHEEEYSPAYDAAIRDWARNSKHVANLMRRVDNRRIDIIKQIFLDLGRSEEEAFIRARVTYFQQVGYYILGLGESKETREKLRPIYAKVLIGEPILP